MLFLDMLLVGLRLYFLYSTMLLSIMNDTSFRSQIGKVYNRRVENKKLSSKG